METPEEICLKALKEIQNICYPILDSGKYETSHSRIAEIASEAMHSANDLKFKEARLIYGENEKQLNKFDQKSN